MDKSGAKFFRLNEVSVIDIGGADAATIINNLTTNEVVNLSVGQGRETFITDVRGKTVGHVCLYRLADAFRLIGAAGQGDRIASHVDRYTIREDASVVSRDGQFHAIVLDQAAAGRIGIESAADQPTGPTVVEFAGIDSAIQVYRNSWIGQGSAALLVPVTSTDAVVASLLDRSLAEGGLADFHTLRVEARFPWYGIDLDEKNLPQELDRDAEAISFTKGCYLGQETVARLDALGQVQRKLVAWSIRGSTPPAGVILSAGDKPVGRLTSVAAVAPDAAIALGFARRTHFDSGATATGTDDSGTEFTATVL